MGELSAALPLAVEALKRRREVLGNEHMAIGHSLQIVAELLEKSERFVEAERLLRESVASYRQNLPPGHFLTARSLFSLGALLNKLGRPDEADPLLRESLEIRQARLPEGHDRTIKSLAELGHCLTVRQRPEEAESLLLKAFEQLRDPSNETARRIARDLITLYETQGNDARAAAFREILTNVKS